MTVAYDLVVVGGGAGGLVAAKEARRRGASVVIVQDGPVGGDCTFTGCVPSKALLAAAASGADFDDAMGRVHRAVERIAATEDAAALAAFDIDVIDGFARFTSPTSLEVDGRTISSRRFVVATGARPSLPPIPGLRESSPLTTETLFDLSSRPGSMIVLGGGPIGCEMAQAFARLGTRVTLVEALDRILPREEPDASAVIAEALAADGVDVRVGATVERIEQMVDGQVCAHLADGSRVGATHLLAAIGRVPSGRGFGLEDIGVELDARGAVVVDATLATSVPGIWAVGDVTGGLQFTHVAGRMGWVAASNALSKLARVRGFRFDPTNVPWATFTAPEVGRVGLTEAEAAALHPTARVAHLPLDHVDRAIAVGAERGFVKLIAAPKRGARHLGGGRLVGATIVAPTGGDLDHEAALAMQTNMFVGRLAQTAHAYPTWAAAVQQAALQFFGTSSGFTARPVRAG
ncbi:MAG TPA: FAD-dependent oxidoreductase [Acidimicrobiales bacterium]|nr:FAD-dependent oxidoreductase [Acidimicrobiales bacterium]